MSKLLRLIISLISIGVLLNTNGSVAQTETEIKCLNGGSRLDLEYSVICMCPDLYYGTYCETSYACLLSGCQNGSTCVWNKNYVKKEDENEFDAELNSYDCICAPGYTGKRCEDKIN